MLFDRALSALCAALQIRKCYIYMYTRLDIRDCLCLRSHLHFRTSVTRLRTFGCTLRGCDIFNPSIWSGSVLNSNNMLCIYMIVFTRCLPGSLPSQSPLPLQDRPPVSCHNLVCFANAYKTLAGSRYVCACVWCGARFSDKAFSYSEVKYCNPTSEYLSCTYVRTYVRAYVSELTCWCVTTP